MVKELTDHAVINQVLLADEKKIRKIIHIDMDAFFVAVEIRDNPLLANKPVAVGGSSRSRGVLSTCNYIARQYGVSSAMPTHIAVQKCPDLIIVPGRMTVYQEVSQKIREIMLRYCDVIEPLSLDEAFLDVSECKLFKGSATLIAQDIRYTIENELNLTASAGVAPLKFLAKVASDLNKPNGQYVIEPKKVQSFIDEMSLKKIPGVGKVTFQKLNQHGLFYGKDIKKVKKEDLYAKFGKFGEVLWQRCHGIDPRVIAPSRLRKSVGVERTFKENISQFNDLQKYLSEFLLPELIKRSKRHLEKRKINKLSVKVKFADFQLTTKACQSNEFNPQLFDQLLSEALARGVGKSVRLLGLQIGLSDEINRPLQFSLQLDE